MIESTCAIGRDPSVEPSTFLRGRTPSAPERSARSTCHRLELGDAVVVRHSYLKGARPADGGSFGPFALPARRRDLGEGAKAGACFVEIKNTSSARVAGSPTSPTSGTRTSASASNLERGTIIANYDRRGEARTMIGGRVRIAVDTAFMASVKVGGDAYSAAGLSSPRTSRRARWRSPASARPDERGYAERQR